MCIRDRYNPDKFIQYLLSIKENGADVDTWTLSELQTEVKTYKRLYAVDDVSDSQVVTTYKRQSSTIFPDLPDTQPSVTLPPEKPTQSFPQEEAQEQVESPAVAQEENKDVCMVSTRQPDSQESEDIEANVVEPKIVKPGFLSRSYVAYGIKVCSKEAVTYRKEDDFVLLRNALVKTCPGYFIPALPQNPIKKLDFEHMQSRKVDLEIFLHRVLEHPLLKKLAVVRSFVTAESEDGLENVRKELSKCSGPKELPEFVTVEGAANVAVTDSLVQSCKEINEASKQISDEFTNLKYYNSELIENFNTLYNTLSKVSSAYRRLATAYSSTDMHDLYMIFDTLGDSFEKMMESCRQFQGSIDENFHKFFKYPAREILTVKDALTQWNDYQSQYKKIKKKLKDKKEGLFLQKQVTAWDLSPECQHTLEVLFKDKKTAFKEMLPGETKEVNKLKGVYGYYCNKIPEEYKRICGKNAKEMQKHMMQVARMNCDIFDRLYKLWDDTYKYFDTKVGQPSN
eukprot:TRINITY_DN1032_c0_g3_i2.p1 TRINITY_DN1032_c0_g3~~TRINITY_DN1032_c0_g3_i2.p1  ORF type:complete len:511 (-),score=138.56 TRINITY_DN1032_c0_g3_i2:139-1671(-)